MKQLIGFYLDYVNNFLTVDKFAKYYSLDKKDAEDIIYLGRIYHEKQVEIYKQS